MLYRYEKIFDLVCSVLSQLNAEFVEHGKRVAYYALRYSLDEEGLSERAVYRRVSAALFHDIGAYKVEKGERENIMRFDAVNTFPHALASYLFLKFFSPLGEDAEPVLYHHAFWSQREGYPAEPFREGNLIHLFDRYDILKTKGKSDCYIRKQLCETAGIFEPVAVEKFFNLLKREPICEKIDNLTYSEELERYFSSVAVSASDIENYLRMLSFTFEVHSYSTLFHSNMTAGAAYAISEYLGVDQENRNRIFVAGLVHDLGKIKTPLSILEKPAGLTAEEMLVMKKHVVYTKEIIADYFDPQTVRNAARHHEKLNGTGYPDGLFGDELNLYERILCVADIISALYTKRSYKDSFETERVVEILDGMVKRNEIDARVVCAFETHIPEIVAFLNRENDKITARYESAAAEYEALHAKPLGR